MISLLRCVDINIAGGGKNNNPKSADGAKTRWVKLLELSADQGSGLELFP